MARPPSSGSDPESSAPDGLVSLEGITKSFREGEQERTVLDNLNAEIQPGEFVVLMGRSGAGKSTLLNLISGIDLPTSGRVVIGGTDLTRLSETDRTLFRRENIGFIFQSFNLISTLTVAENITLPLELSGRGDEEARALEVLDRVGLADRGDSFPDLLSGGEQQRVALARALSADPLLILADEPTGNLDYETGQQVMDVLTELVRDYGKTILIATHDRTLIDEADRCLTLHGGKLEAGVPDFVEG
ncbi:MAG: ATP-binding cassette domain-containing protein [Bacteroidetes bacterium]|jgi:putative ABC transport system ATP-binding protein|nr:ATP-binding cassette domain-containing protein [Bacteroidota bacterium]